MILGVQAVFRNWATPCVEREAEQKRTKLSETDSQRDLSCDCIDRKLHLDDAVAVLRWSGFGRNGRVQITCRAHTGQDDSVTRIAVFHQLIEYTCPPKCQHETEVGKESGEERNQVTGLGRKLQVNICTKSIMVQVSSSRVVSKIYVGRLRDEAQ